MLTPPKAFQRGLAVAREMAGWRIIDSDPAAVCMDEKTLMGSYSASVDIQDETVDLVFNGGIPFEKLISHRFALADAVAAIHLASNPQPDSMKIVIQSGGKR